MTFFYYFVIVLLRPRFSWFPYITEKPGFFFFQHLFSEIPINDRGLDEIIALSHVVKLSKCLSNIHADHRG